MIITPGSRAHPCPQPAVTMQTNGVTVQTTPPPRRSNQTKRSGYIVIFGDAVICIFSDGQQPSWAGGW